MLAYLLICVLLSTLGFKHMQNIQGLISQIGVQFSITIKSCSNASLIIAILLIMKLHNQQKFQQIGAGLPQFAPVYYRDIS